MRTSFVAFLALFCGLGACRSQPPGRATSGPSDADKQADAKRTPSGDDDRTVHIEVLHPAPTTGDRRAFLLRFGLDLTAFACIKDGAFSASDIACSVVIGSDADVALHDLGRKRAEPRIVDFEAADEELAGFSIAPTVELKPPKDARFTPGNYPWASPGPLDGYALSPPGPAHRLVVTAAGRRLAEEGVGTRCELVPWWPFCKSTPAKSWQGARLAAATHGIDESERAALGAAIRATGNELVEIRQILDVELDGKAPSERLYTVRLDATEDAVEPPTSSIWLRDGARFRRADPPPQSDLGGTHLLVLAAVDLDGDGAAELLLRGSYYEGVFYQLLRWRGSWELAASFIDGA